MKNKLKKLAEQALTGLFWLLSKLPSRKKRIYFESFHGKQYSDNPRAVYELLRTEQSEYQLIWGVSRGYETPFLTEKIDFLPRLSWRWMWAVTHADFWIVNTRMPAFCVKPSRTQMIQTWHGTPLKKIGLDIEQVGITGYSTQSYRESFEKESRRWDYLISPNAYSTKIFQRAFAYQGPVLEIGYPRNDQLVRHGQDVSYQKRLKEKMGLPVDKKLVLYAPTWRDNHVLTNGQYEFEPMLDLSAFQSALGADVTVLVRMHYLVKPPKKAHDQWVDVSGFEDMSDLLLVSDVLITDYSSSFFDYYLLNRPMIFFMPDRQQYEQELRGTYFDIEGALPGPVVTKAEALVSATKQALTTPYLNLKKRTINKQFYDRIVEKETGEAAKKIVALIERNDA